jgi:hypothetical protein
MTSQLRNPDREHDAWIIDVHSNGIPSTQALATVHVPTAL